MFVKALRLSRKRLISVICILRLLYQIIYPQFHLVFDVKRKLYYIVNISVIINYFTFLHVTIHSFKKDGRKFACQTIHQFFPN